MMNMFRRIALSSAMALLWKQFRLGSTIPKPTFRPTRQELRRLPTRSWSIRGV